MCWKMQKKVYCRFIFCLCYVVNIVNLPCIGDTKYLENCPLPPFLGSANSLDQCFSKWVPRRGLGGSDRRKCIMAEEFSSPSKMCSYELKFIGDVRH
jgi:hypothetical protein